MSDVIAGIDYTSCPLETVLSALDEIDSHAFYRLKCFESAGLYECLGVRGFKRLVSSLIPKAGHEWKRNYYLPPERDLYSLINFERETRVNEGVHFFGFLASCLSLYSLPLALSNLYCCLLQRYNRARVINTLREAVSILSDRS